MRSEGALLKSACVLGVLMASCLSATAQKSEFPDRRNTLL